MPDLFLRYLQFKESILQILISNACFLVSPLTYSDVHGIESKKHI